MNIDYAIIVKSKTRLESLIERFNTTAQAKFYIESLGGDFKDYEMEHTDFKYALNSFQSQLTNVIKYKIIDKEFLSSYIFADNNVIIVIGQDGLVANTAKYSNGVPIIAINPNKGRYNGVLLPFSIIDFIKPLEAILNNNYKSKKIYFAEAKLNDNQRLLAFNDLFIGKSSHTSAKYKITFQNKSEFHSSSGIIVSTQAGETGWLSSIFNMAYGITNVFNEKLIQKPFHLKQNQLFFAVREAYKSVNSQIGISAGIIQNKKLIIESLMPTDGVIFSDGIETDFLNFNSGAIAEIGIAKEFANLVVA